MKESNIEIINSIIDKGTNISSFDKMVLEKISNDENFDANTFMLDLKQEIYNYLCQYTFLDNILYASDSYEYVYIAKCEEFELDGKIADVLYIANVLYFELEEIFEISFDDISKIVSELYSTVFNKDAKYEAVIMRKYHYDYMFNENNELYSKYL